MDAPIQRLQHYISYLPFLSFFRDRESVPEPSEVTNEVAFRFKDCEDTAGHQPRRSRRRSMSAQNSSSVISF